MSDKSFREETTQMPSEDVGDKDILRSGEVLGDYRILELLGRGGMGEVYLAENRVDGSRVALKVISREASGPGFLERFRVESRVMSGLRHPHIVQVHHAGESRGIYYLTMDYIAGPDGKPRTMADELDGVGAAVPAALSEARVRELLNQLLAGLSAAHSKGVVHRDLKPANLLLDAEGNLHIADFGLAKVVGEDFVSQLVKKSISVSMGKSIGEKETEVPGSSKREQYEGTSTGAILGTYDYMSPEQKVGGAVTEQSDLYSVGLILYRMLTGRKPSARSKAVSFYGVSPAWDPIVDKLLEEEFLDRYGSAVEVLEDVRGLGLGEASHKAHKGTKIVGGLVVGCLLAVGGWMWSEGTWRTGEGRGKQQGEGSPVGGAAPTAPPTASTALKKLPTKEPIAAPLPPPQPIGVPPVEIPEAEAIKKRARLAYVNWTEGIAYTHLAEAVLEKKMGYDVKITAMDVGPAYAAVAQGDYDAFMESWTLLHQDYIRKFRDSLTRLGRVYDGATTGLVVPSYVPIDRLAELKGNEDRFGGMITGIDAGAGMMRSTEKKLIPAYELDMKLLASSGPAMVAALGDAIKKEEWIVVTAWSPHWIFARWDLKFLEQSPKKTVWAKNNIEIIGRAGLRTDKPELADFLSNMHFTDAELSDLMLQIHDSHEDVETVVRTWMQDHPDVWRDWIP